MFSNLSSTLLPTKPAKSPPMNASPYFAILRMNLPMDRATFVDTLSAEARISLHEFDVTGQDLQMQAAFQHVHAYHITSARDDLPAPWFASRVLIDNCPKLLAVSTYGAGYDTVNLQDCTKAGICVVNQAGSNARAVAEHTLALILGLSKRINENDRKLRRGEKFTRAQGMGFELLGRTLGLVGLGHTGTQMALLGRAVGMKVIASDPFLTADQITARGAESASLDALIAQADVISLHCPRDESTLGMFNAQRFAAMKKGALFVSTARGDIHDEVALQHALISGHLSGAGLDVWSVEPPDASHPLLQLDNVVASYHTAGVSVDARYQMASMSAQQLLMIAQGHRPSRLLNPEVWPDYCKRFKAILGRDIQSI